jgi:NAD(P)-dependent dehydrogenase (short-subunit alcohol dehydrogenase family)
MKLDSRVAIVTGAGRGIGSIIAKAFAREGAAVALVSRTISQLKQVQAEIFDSGGKSIVIPTDVSEETAVEAMVERVEKELGPIDVLMNNAGSFAAIGPVSHVDPATWWKDVTINLFGVFLCCRAVLQGMMERKRGWIINMIGGGTATPFPYGSGYGSSKAAVMRFTECLAKEAGEYNIAVFAMGPGLVRTAMTEYQLTTDEGRRWLPRIKGMFEENKDVPPTMAAELAVSLASGNFDELTGRAFSVHDDLEKILDQKEQIIQKDRKTLRLI